MKTIHTPSKDYLKDYLSIAPTSLALERAIECVQLARLRFEHPALDLGCGDGVFGSIFFDRETFADVGTDISFEELAQAQRRQVYRMLVDASAEGLPFPTGYFKTVLANSVMEHIPNLDGSLTEIGRVLADGGALFITVPTPNYEQMFFWTRFFSALCLNGLSRYYRRTVNNLFRHYHVYDPAKWTSRIEAAGMRVIRWSYYLTPGVVALDDLLYPVALYNRVIKALAGRWILFPALRRPIASVLAVLWRGAYHSQSDQGGYILIEATRACR